MITGAHLDGNFMDVLCHYASPLGGITLACDGAALTGLWFEGQRYFARTLDADRGNRELPVLDRAERWLAAYFRGEDPEGNPFYVSRS